MYTVLIDPIWNKSAVGEYKKLVIDFYCNSSIQLKVQDRAAGQKCLEQSLKKIAIEQGTKNYYLKDNANYGQNVWRVSNIAMTKAWYGINYTKCEEECKNKLVETFRPKLSGIEI